MRSEGKIPLIQQIAWNASITEDATAIVEFWVQGEHFFCFIYFKVQYVLDNVHMETSDFKTAVQSLTSIRSGQESWRIYLNETGRR